MPPFADLPAVNAWLEARCIERWSELAHGVLPGSVAAVHAEEQSSLMPVGRAFDGFTHHCHILETGNDSFRFRNSSADGKGRKTKTTA